MKAWQHFCTITHHKILVMKGCFRVGLYRQGLMHDLSKYGWTEFRVGAKYYQGTRSPNNAERESLDIRLHGFIIRDAISITMSIGLTMDWANKKD